jgi:hypothetical protein
MLRKILVENALATYPRLARDAATPATANAKEDV